MKNIFNSIMLTKPSSNVFDLSHDVKMSFNMGKLYPIMVNEVVPGDKFNITSNIMLRFAPLIAPVMHKVDCYTHFFFVPNRILWSGWETFITGSKSEAETPAFPYFADVDENVKSLTDYLGLPVSVGAIDRVNALPYAAYQCIFNEYYRDQNLEDEINYKLDDGDNSSRFATDFSLLRTRAWQHDYFTAALPWAQKGDAVTIPIGNFTDVGVVMTADDEQTYWRASDGTTTVPAGNYPVGSQNLSTSTSGASNIDNGKYVKYDPNGTLVAQTSELEAEASTINDLRRAFKLQEWLEKNARGGTRYIESILAHFGVKSSDARLQRPEYIGGSNTPMTISEVLQTSESATSPQGNMAGHGIAVGGSKSMNYYAEEHGFIIGIISVRPKTAYQNGIARQWSKFDRLDYYWPTFAHLGEQEIKNREVYYNTSGPQDPDATFGYTPRYAEYRYTDSRVAGEFRENLDYWHLGRKFDDQPLLNAAFIKCEPSRRIFAVEAPDGEDTIYSHVYLQIKATRKMPRYATPMM